MNFSIYINRKTDYKLTHKLNGKVPFNNHRRQTMTKDDIIGFSLIPLVLVGCIYNEELADLIGILLNNFFACLG